MKSIEKAIKTLLDKNPFYAHFFLNSKIEYDKYGVPTAGAALTPTNTVIVFNTTYIDSLTQEEVCAVVEHEVDHILFDHVSAMKHDKMLNKDVANVAMDGAINQYIQNIPEGGITLKMLEKITGGKLEPLQDWEYYYAKLIPHAKKMEGMRGHDDHDADIPSQCKPGEGREVLRSSLDKAVKASKGNVPKHVAKTLSDLSAPSTLPWKQILANFVSRSTASITKNTRKKSNRRFGLEQPGKVKKRELTLGVCVDSSGSISDEAYLAFMAEIERISKIVGTTYVIDADCVVQNVQTVSKNKQLKKERYGNGGTAYSPAIKEAVRLKCDAIIYFGDFDSSDTPENPNKPFLWVGVGTQEPPAKFGTCVRL